MVRSALKGLQASASAAQHHGKAIELVIEGVRSSAKRDVLEHLALTAIQSGIASDAVVLDRRFRESASAGALGASADLANCPAALLAWLAAELGLAPAFPAMDDLRVPADELPNFDVVSGHDLIGARSLLTLRLRSPGWRLNDRVAEKPAVDVLP